MAFSTIRSERQLMELMENRHGLVVNAKVTQTTGKAELEAAADLVDALSGTDRINAGRGQEPQNEGLRGGYA
jgi:hypothetical protein